MTGRISLGLNGPTYYNGYSPFLNWWKTGAASLATNVVTQAGGFLMAAIVWGNGSSKTPISIAGDETYSTATSANGHSEYYVNSVSANASNDATISWSGTYAAAMGMLTWR